MSWCVLVEPETRRELLALPPGIRDRVMQRIEALAENPRPANVQRLTGTLRGSFRIRVGDYRVSYEIDDQARVITVWAVGHRSRFCDDAGRRRH